MTNPPPPRSPWQRLYGAGHTLRERWYRGRAARLPRPVVSLGNLHWGGTGKTPLVAAVAAYLCDRGLRVAVLSRGYGSRGSGLRLVSGWEGGPRLDAAIAGDEPVLLARELPGVAVVVHPRRAVAGESALASLSPPPDLFLLDDGFSHLGLARDLDLLALPESDPFGGGRLFPSGRLREPLAAARRAPGALITGPTASTEAAGQVRAALEPFGFSGPVFAAPTRLLPARRFDGGALESGSRVVLASGIARPERFRAAALTQGFEIAGELVYPDHHTFPLKSLRAISEARERTGATVVLVTSKDAVKLQGFADTRLAHLPLAVLPVAAEPEPAFWL